MSCACDCIVAVADVGPHRLETVIRPCSMHRRFADEEIRIAQRETSYRIPVRRRGADDPAYVEFPQ